MDQFERAVVVADRLRRLAPVAVEDRAANAIQELQIEKRNFPKFVEVGAAMEHELRKVGTSGRLPISENGNEKARGRSPGAGCIFAMMNLCR
jgi:hypothetical protein